MYVPSAFFLSKLMAQAIDHAVAGPFSGVLDGTFVGLYVDPTPALTPQSTLTNITEAGYTGYARQALTWHAPYVDGAPAETVQSASVFFQPTDAVTPQIITGMFVADALTAGNLLFSQRLPGGNQSMASAANAFALAVLFQLGYGADYGDSVVIS